MFSISSIITNALINNAHLSPLRFEDDSSKVSSVTITYVPDLLTNSSNGGLRIDADNVGLVVIELFNNANIASFENNNDDNERNDSKGDKLYVDLSLRQLQNFVDSATTKGFVFKGKPEYDMRRLYNYFGANGNRNVSGDQRLQREEIITRFVEPISKLC